MWHQWETIGKVLRKLPKTGILLILGHTVAKTLDFWGPCSPYICKYLQWVCKTILMWTKWKPFKKLAKRPEFWLVWGPKVVPNLGFWGPYSTHRWIYFYILSTSLKIAPIGIQSKTDLNSELTFFYKLVENLDFDYFRGPEICDFFSHLAYKSRFVWIQ